ncbi:endopeptidase La [Brachymonas chironomi]|uniref:endopeptidase La n=1 Tax=Brachymonas chironomi TaxID=491919 RepID=UPI0003683905|nr:endopeptidase La [Brachymonas chironomi]
MTDFAYLPPESVELPMLPLRDVVVFPHMVIPLFVGRAKSIAALEAAMEADRTVMLVAQKSAADDEPSIEDMFETGCVASILQLLKLPDGTVKVLVEGRQRARIEAVTDGEEYFTAKVLPVAADETQKPDTEDAGREQEALRRALMQSFEQYVKLNKKVPQEILTSITGIDEVGRLADTIAAHLPLSLENKQQVLDQGQVQQRLEFLFARIEHELDILNMDKRIRGRVKRQMEKSQRDFYLNEQVKAIQKELGDGEEGADLEELEKKIKAARMPKAALTKAESELRKLKLMSPMSAEAGVARNYLDVLVNLPWSKKTRIKTSLAEAQRILDEDHYGLERVKERILEYLAVQQRVDKIKAPILCLVGPPGVGKTSLGQSVAKATGRKYVRMALGGMRDEAEIRGHRRTYIGALPGKILQNLTKAGTRNPLFLLDEIDKLGADFRGDPSSALLEVLDPEQNHTFNDHYVELDFDLSDVMFVATSNSMKIPAALLDRMEVIRLSGYTEDEKVNIARRYLLPKQMENNGVKDSELEVADDAIRDIVRYYTREAGVRGLERELAKICRKVVMQVQLKQVSDKVTVDSEKLNDYLGVRRHRFGRASEANKVGEVVGLAWTEVGGELLTIETAIMPGKGVIQRTGSLGDVMKESVEAARTVVRSRAGQLGIADEAFEKKDIHIHVPDGATPKDGPSAGAAMTTALVSALTGIPVRSDVAMTGEITLRGEVTIIGGLKEKLLAALRGGIRQVIIPEENMKDLQEIPDNVKEDLEITPVKWIDQVLAIALERQPEPLPGAEPVAGTDADEALADVPPVAKAKRATRSKRQATKH